MTTNYAPARPLLRFVFAAAALMATLACGAFIDELAQVVPADTLQAVAMPQLAAVANAR
jgi:hypothetical protein